VANGSVTRREELRQGRKRLLTLARLREDLYYLLNAFTMTVPPLRERRQEIPLLLRYYMNNLAAKFGKNPLSISDRLIQACLRYHWPGNLRELGNFVKRYLVLEDEKLVVDELQVKSRGDYASVEEPPLSGRSFPP